MSPEQARGQPIDARTDVWAVGAVLYELVTGHPPFDGRTASDVVANVLHVEPPPLERFAHDCPPELQRIVSKCLRKDRGHRYQTMRDVALDLEALGDTLRGGGTSAPVPGGEPATHESDARPGRLVSGPNAGGSSFAPVAWRGWAACRSCRRRHRVAGGTRELAGDHAPGRNQGARSEAADV